MLVTKTPNVVSLSADNREWLLTLRPEVAMRFKQMFPKVSKHKTHCIHLVNSAENCRDLLWFGQRFDLEWKAEELALAEAAAQSHTDQQKRIESAVFGNIQPRNFTLHHPLREYQASAAEVMLTVKSALLGDDVGLGKTATAIGVMTKCLPALVVCQPSLLNQWSKEQIPKFLPQAKVHQVKVGGLYKPTPSDFYVIPYTRLRKWVYHLIDVCGIRSVVYDEVQELRHEDTAKYDAAEILAARIEHVYGCSATPIYNYGEEIFNIMEVLRPGALGNREEFYREWCTGMARRAVAEPKALSFYMRSNGMMISRTRKEVGRELPPITRMCQTVDADSKPLEAIKADIVNMARDLLTGTFNQRGVAAREIDLRMREATGVAKAPAVAEFCRVILERGDKLLVFCWHHKVYQILEEALREFRPVRYMGEQNITQKAEAKRRFMLPSDDPQSSQLMLMSLRAAPGLDGLQDVCNTCVYAEPDWSPSVHIQCTGRLWRELSIGDGTMNQVLEIFLLAEDGSDPAMAEILGIKTSQLEGLMRPGDESAEFLEVDPNRIKTMLLDYAKRHNIPLPNDGKSTDHTNTNNPGVQIGAPGDLTQHHAVFSTHC